MTATLAPLVCFFLCLELAGGHGHVGREMGREVQVKWTLDTCILYMLREFPLSLPHEVYMRQAT